MNLQEPIYFPLVEAAEMLGMSTVLLIQQGAFGRIRIVIPKPPKPCFIVETIDYDKREHTSDFKNEGWIENLYFTRYHIDGDINYGSDYPQGPTLPVHRVSLSEFESGFLEQDLVLYIHRLEDGRFSELVKLRNPCTGDPLKLKDAKLSVLAKDIELLKQAQLTQTKARTPQTHELKNSTTLEGMVEEIGLEISKTYFRSNRSRLKGYLRLIWERYEDEPNAENFLKRLTADGFVNDFDKPVYDREIAPIYKISLSKGIWATYDGDLKKVEPALKLTTVHNNCSSKWISTSKKKTRRQ